jgi:peptidoglycan/LPS O-acetylase OafA/YrhL
MRRTAQDATPRAVAVIDTGEETPHRDKAVGSKRFVVLDLYRFLAAMGVFFFHFAELSRNPSLLNRVEHFQLFVDFFFVLSGFVIARTYRDSVRDVSEITTFLWRRIARIYPLHVLMLLVFLVTSNANTSI